MGFLDLIRKVSGSGPAAAPPDTAPVSDTCPAAAGGIAGCCARLLPQEDPSMPFQISCYGARLAGNKAALADACSAAGVAPDMHALFTAMAMIETNNMCISERDATKDDNDDGSANVSVFNLSVDLVRSAGYQGHPSELNSNLEEAVAVLAGAMRQWGVEPTLDFVRGGRTGFNDHVSYGCADYRRTVATVLEQIERDPSLLSDSRRVEVELVHV